MTRKDWAWWLRSIGKPPMEYQRAQALMRSLQAHKAKIDRAVWTLEMAMREVRIADTDDDMTVARIRLMAEAIPAADVLGFDQTYGVNHF